jgi:hypothetical protein
MEVSNTVDIETTSSQTQLLDVSTEAGMAMTSPSLLIDESSIPLGEIVFSGTQKLIASVEGTLGTATPCSTIDGSNMVPSDMITPPTLELVRSTECITAMDQPSANTYTPTPVCDLVNNNSPELQAQSGLVEPSSDMDSSHIADRSNELSKLVEATLVEIPELPFGPFSVESDPDVVSPSEPADASYILSKAIEHKISQDDVTHEMNTSFLDTGNEIITSELTQKTSAESPELGSSTHLESTPTSPASNTNTGYEPLESSLTEFIKLNLSPKKSSPKLEVCGVSNRLEAIETNSGERSRRNPFAADASLKNRPSLSIDNSTVVADPFDTSSSSQGVQERAYTAQATPRLNDPPFSTDGSNQTLECVDTSSQEISELTSPSYAPPETTSTSSSPHSFTVLPSTLELSLPEIQDTAFSEETPVMRTHPFSSADSHNNVPESVDTSSIEMLDFIVSVESNSDTAFFPATSGFSSVVPGNFDTSQSEMEDQTVSEAASGMNSPTYSVDGMDVGFQSDETNATNMLNLDHPASASLDVAPSGEDATTVPKCSKSTGSEIRNTSSSNDTMSGPSVSIKETATGTPRRLQPGWGSPMFESLYGASWVQERPQVLDAGSDFDVRNLAKMSEHVTSGDAAANMAQPYAYEISTMASESVQMGSPEIKLEPLSADAIPYMNTLPSAIGGPSAKSKPPEKPAAEWLEAAGAMATPVDTDTSTMIERSVERMPFDMQPVRVSITQDAGSRYMCPEDTGNSPRKRVHFKIEDGEEDQPLAKKLRQKFVPVWDVPQTKTKDVLEKSFEDIEMGVLDVHKVWSPTEASQDMILPPSIPSDTNMTFQKIETGDFEAWEVPPSAEMPPQLSMDSKHPDLEKSLTTAPSSIDITQSKSNK